MTDRNHPASSVEFLSRLHDGEVAAPERRAFEEHRAACADCREAADAFEASLAAFRSSDVAPAPADLSARILRRIRSQSPSRRPFGVTFGIDVRWAGLLAAALVAVLLSAPLVLRKPAPALVPHPPISASIVDAPAQPKGADAATRAEARDAVPKVAAAPAPAAPASSVRREVASAEAAPPSKPAAIEPPADDEKRRFAPEPRPAAGPAPLRARSTLEAPGGEAGAALEDVRAAPPAPHLLVTVLDGQGEAPAIVEGPDASLLTEFRGREFVLTVEASGRVRSIEPSVANGYVAPPSAKSAEGAAAAATEPLQTLRFAPGDRPRRLAIRVE